MMYYFPRTKVGTVTAQHYYTACHAALEGILSPKVINVMNHV
jgi:hypothetical protein